VQVDVTVQDRYGNPIVGLDIANFSIFDNGTIVAEPTLSYRAQQSERADVVIIAEHSQEVQRKSSKMGVAIEALAGEFSGTGSMRLVSAANYPVLEASGDLPPIEYRNASLRGTYSRDWDFGSALYYAATELFDYGGKRAVIFVGNGYLPQHAFNTYELETLLDYFIENDIVLHFVKIEDKPVSDELLYLVTKSGGTVRYYYDPLGARGFAKEVMLQVSGRYALKYISQAPTGFGKAYILMTVEAAYLKRSGRDELGYFSPLEF
jgi:hypothetical protein